MAVTPSEILALTNEPAVFVQRGKILFANSGARKVLGEDITGKAVREVFGKNISEMQSSSFISGFKASNNIKYIVRVSPVGSGQVYFLSPHSVETQLINDTVISVLKNNLAIFSIADERAMELAEELGSERLSRYLCSMNHSMLRVSRLIRNISLIQAANAGQLLFSPITFDLCELCRDIVDSVKVLKRDEDIRFEHEGRVLINGDSVLIELMLLNLVSNCLLHAVGHEVISLNIIESVNNVIISISDDGCGIESEQLAKVFERYRFDFSLSEMSSGAGFGLNAALCVAEQHGGTLVLESRPGFGTTVRASLQRGKSDTLSAVSAKYETNMRSFLTGLADCLPDDCFSWKYFE